MGAIVEYMAQVDAMETGLAAYAKRSFEPFSELFVDGGSQHEYYSKQWKTPIGHRKLANRTPLQMERDRILYSSGMRKQTEKYHVLYNGQRRIVRNYTTHAMRMAQVTRSICRGLKLNADFGEAMALGSKVGAVPFIHAAKAPIAEWVREKVISLDNQSAKHNPLVHSPEKQLAIEFGGATLPAWLKRLRSESVLQKVRQYMPWAAGIHVDDPYSSGQESYWMLCTNPYVLESSRNAYAPETMYGIWRHTRGLAPSKGSFSHKFKLDEVTNAIQWYHCTYEAIVVQYADDITWVIENLNDANNAAILNRRRSVYEALQSTLGADIPEGLLRPMIGNDPGGLYTFFIHNFVAHSEEVLSRLKDGADFRIAMRNGEAAESIGLSEEAENLLAQMAAFLDGQVFTEARVQNRTSMLRTISTACVELLYNGVDEILPRMIEERAMLERWSRDMTVKAQELLQDPVHRIQVAVDVLAEMGDQEIYDFVGIQSL